MFINVYFTEFFIKYFLIFNNFWNTVFVYGILQLRQCDFLIDFIYLLEHFITPSLLIPTFVTSHHHYVYLHFFVYLTSNNIHETFILVLNDYIVDNLNIIINIFNYHFIRKFKVSAPKRKIFLT